MTEYEIEKQQIETVFCLCGGELHEKHPKFTDEFEEYFQWWYEGTPDYAEADFGDRDRQYRTAVVCELFGNRKTPEGWTRENVYGSSGESQCLCAYHEDFETKNCEVCEGDGLVYIGDGWREVVFSKEWE